MVMLNIEHIKNATTIYTYLDDLRRNTNHNGGKAPMRIRSLLSTPGVGLTINIIVYVQTAPDLYSPPDRLLSTETPLPRNEHLLTS